MMKNLVEIAEWISLIPFLTQLTARLNGSLVLEALYYYQSPVVIEQIKMKQL